jgi:hypothetical protein
MDGCWYNERLNSKTEACKRLGYTGCVGRNDSNPSRGSSGHPAGTRPGQTHKKPKDLSVREREEFGCVGGGWVYVLYKCEGVT